MIRILFATALFLGALAIVWMGSVFINTDSLAFTVTAIIGGVYCIVCVCPLYTACLFNAVICHGSLGIC